MAAGWDVTVLERVASSYVDGRVVLLGDAAHAMTPFLAQGARQALEDAVTLAATDLATYDRTRRQRTQRMARQDPRGSACRRIRWCTGR